MRVVRVNGTDFVFPTLRKRQREEADDMTCKLPNRLSENDFFMGSQHPPINVSKPEFYIFLMMNDILDCLGKLVERDA